jgi:hypothetical protein
MMGLKEDYKDLKETLMLVTHAHQGRVRIHRSEIEDFYGKNRRLVTRMDENGHLEIRVLDDDAPEPGLMLCDRASCPVAANCRRANQHYDRLKRVENETVTFMAHTPVGKDCPTYLPIDPKFKPKPKPPSAPTGGRLA